MDSQNVINSGGLSGSRLGFKGTEALGNGISALFTLEYGVDVDANTGLGNSSAGARQQMVGLTGGFGTIVAGRLQTAGYDFACSTNPIGGSALDPIAKLGVSTLLSCAGSGRASNAAAYISPNFGGFTVAVNHGRVTEAANGFGSYTYALNTATGKIVETGVVGTDTGKDAYANLLTGVYSNGPVAANLTYSKISMANTPGSDDVVEYGLGGSFDFKMAKVFGSYQTAKTGDASRNNKWQLSGAIPVGAGAVVLQYAKNGIKSTAASDNSTAWNLSYTHSLSKRTTAYAGYTRVSNDDGAKAAAVLTPTLGGNSSVVAAGVRHTF
jgi:predicted porin